jgi:hypothetical protein
MKFISKFFSPKEKAVSPTPIHQQSPEPPVFNEPVQVSIEKGLSAHFFRKDGESWPGIDWAVACTSGSQKQVYIVRTYHSQNPPDSTQNPVLADKAARYIFEKCARGEIISQSEIHIVE